MRTSRPCYQIIPKGYAQAVHRLTHTFTRTVHRLSAGLSTASLEALSRYSVSLRRGWSVGTPPRRTAPGPGRRPTATIGRDD